MSEYTLRQLSEALDMSRRTILHYVRQGLLHPPVFRGRKTTYDEDTYLRLLAIRRLRDDEGLGLEGIRERLDRLSPAEIAALGASGAFAGGLDDTGTEVGIGTIQANDAITTSVDDSDAEGPPPSLMIPTTTGPTTTGPTTTGPTTSPGGTTWSRFALLPGLELHLRSDASPVIRRLAQEIIETYGSREL